MRAATQMAATTATARPASTPSTSSGETLTRLIRIGMMIGAVSGNHAAKCAVGDSGFATIGWMSTALAMSGSITGNAACCASCSLFTIAPTAANSAE